MIEQNKSLVELGLTARASQADIRQRYLELIKRYPPEREPAKFAEIQKAYDAVKDPLLLAEALLDQDIEMPEWHKTIDREANNPPLLSASMLLALGNFPPAPSGS